MSAYGLSVLAFVLLLVAFGFLNESCASLVWRQLSSAIRFQWLSIVFLVAAFVAVIASAISHHLS